MKKIITLLIIVLLIIGVAIYAFMASQKNAVTEIGPGAVRPATEGTEQPAENDALKSLKELVSQGIPQRCTFDYQDPDSGKNTGTMFISGNKLRGDFMIKDEEGNVTNGGMITDDAYLYTWDNDTKEGFKMALTADIKAESEEIRNNPSKVFDMDKKANYNCGPWVVQDGIFNPPQDVKFADFSEMMKGFGATISPQTTVETETDSDACAACSSMPAEAQAQCKQSLNCE